MRWPSTDPRAWTTLRAQLTIWNTAIVLSMTAATLAAVRFGARGALYREADATLRAAANETAAAVADLRPDRDAVIDFLRRKQAAHEARGWFTHVLTATGTTVWRSDDCPAEVVSAPPTRIDRAENIVQVGSFRYVRIAVDWPDAPLFVRIGMSTTILDASVSAVMRLLVLIGVVLSLLTPLAGFGLALRATRPVADILRTAERLRPTRLGDRLAVRGTGDELDRLALTVNRLLDQVAEHVERQERFVADAAHELRGPLAAMQSTLEVAVSHPRTAADYHAALLEALEAARHLAKLANDLLLLAESSDASAPRIREPVELAVVAGQTVDMFAGVAEEKGVSLDLSVDSAPTVAGDVGRVRQVVGNLLDNALRFTPRGGHVTVRVAAASTGGLLAVRDDGIGIPAADIDRIFDRFAKADPARSRGAGDRCGGLGLAICKSLVDGCGGSIGVASRPGGGTTVTVRLPFWTAAGAVPTGGGLAMPTDA